MVQIRAGDVVPTPWRNGGGRTRELLARPAGSDWMIRVSLADIDANGPFSAFPGVERWFAVVEGAGVVLNFAGAPAPGCALLSGPIRDFNLMVRGGGGVVRVVEPGPLWHEPLQHRGLVTLVFGLPDAPSRFLPAGEGRCGWWLGTSASGT